MTSSGELPATPNLATPALPATLRLGAVELTVTDLDRSVAYYEQALGLRLRERSNGAASLGAGAADLVVLHEEPAARAAGRHAGLFHFALLHPSREELARAALRLAAQRVSMTGASDHGVSEALYLRDPDGNGIELYADRPRELWPFAPDGEGIEMFTAPLDVESLIGAIAGEDPRRHADAGLAMGHVHLHVGDISRGLAFYGDVVGFELMASMPSAAFVAAGGYHHHLGFNTWQGEGIPPAPPGTIGLRHWTVVLPTAGDVSVVAERLRAGGHAAEQREDGVLTRDPWGTALLLAAEAAVH